MKYALRNMICFVICSFALILTGQSSLAYAATQTAGDDVAILGAEVSSHKKYTMYLGTKDKDTMKQEISTENIKSRMRDICLKYVDGYTVSVMEGYYRDEKGNPIYEVSLVYFFLDTPIEALKRIMDEAILEFNQSSILLEESEVKSVFYDGTHKAK